jgi:Domain of unknown function (DUF3854)
MDSQAILDNINGSATAPAAPAGPYIAPAFDPNDDVGDMITRDLKKSGLVAADLHCRRIPVDEVRERLGHAAAKRAKNAVVAFIPYYKATGEPTGSGRCRFYDREKPKYLQPGGEMLGLYFAPKPAFTGEFWPNMLADPSKILYFVEGEKSAALLCKNHVPAIGLGGCWGFSAKRHGLEMLPDFDSINLDGRTVVIVYDADAATKSNVLAARTAFALH